MLNPLRYTTRSRAGNRIACALVCGLSFCFGSRVIAQDGPSLGDQGKIIQVQNIRVKGRLDARIISMPKVKHKMEVIQNRSQLIRTSERVKRVAIADPTIIDIAPYEEDEFAIIGNQLGSTTLTLWFEDDDDPLIYEVTTIRDPNIDEQRRLDYGKLERKIAILFPNSKVYLIPLHEKLVVKGQARDAADAARILQIVRDEAIDNQGGLNGPGGTGDGRGNNGGYDPDGINSNNGNDDLLSSFIVNMLQVPGEYQVMLHVTIAELNRSQARNMGVNFNVLFDSGRHAITSAISGGIPTLTGVFENGNITALINALASNGTAKILSRPSLTTLSGRPAQFLAGGEFAVPTIVGVGGAQAATTTFRGFGTSMIVIPTVVYGDLVRLQIQPTFSQINQNNAVDGIPGLNTRTISTTVELREGQTIVLGGLLSRQTSTQTARIPLLGDIPGIGPLLFSSKSATEDELELLILVTPEIVRAMDPEEVPPMPGYYVTHPNDVEFYRYSMTEGAPDMEVYQLAPYGNGIGYPTPVGFNVFNPSHATPQNGPIPQANQPNGFPTPAPGGMIDQSPRYNGSGNGIPRNGAMQNGVPQMQGLPTPYQASPQMQGMPPANQATPQMNIPPAYQQQMPVQPGYQMAPPARQMQPQLAPTPDPAAQTNRGIRSPTAMRKQLVPNYSRRLFGQRSSSGNTNRKFNVQNSGARQQPSRFQQTRFSQRR